jgi:predicted alpha/beta-fold hydrolase
MPLIRTSTYKPVWYLFHKHLETIVPSALRKVPGSYSRTRLELPDGDFVDLDWMKDSEIQRDKVIIISHGLEGSSLRHYSKGMARYFYDRGWDSLAWNCRSCGGEPNRLARFYHHGDTEDLGRVVDEAIRLGYQTIVLAGFSMGGSFSLKYLGEKGQSVSPKVKGSVSFSVPCDLEAGGKILDSPATFPLYRNRFLGKLKRKIAEKAQRFPEINLSKLNTLTTFEEFNNCYTAPLHGFTDSADFYRRSSCMDFLQHIAVPSLLVNAANDPLLTPECYPVSIAEKSESLYLEIPRRGGHVGFPLIGKKENWMEVRAFEFVSTVILRSKQDHT